MKYLCVDFGEARIGFAHCDKNETIAMGLRTEKVNGIKTAVEKTVAAALETGAEEIVIGMPLRTDGTRGDKSERVERFAEMVREASSLTVRTFDERFSTMHAHQLLNETAISGRKRKNVIDTLSAQLILESFLERKKNIAKIQKDDPEAEK